MAAAPPITGKKYVFDIAMKAPMRRTNDPPKQIPGISTGRSTPRDIPTKSALIERMYRNPIARSDSTVTKSGSRNVYVKKAANAAV